MACFSRSCILSFKTFFRFLSDSGPPLKLPPVPTTCCMSGCANCVWIEYAENLLSNYGDNAEDVKKNILSQIDDPSLKAFIEMELMFRMNK